MRKKTTTGTGTDEVEQLLQAAHDDVLLKLSLNSHIAGSASHSLDPDLSRRFQALKSPSPGPVPPLSRPKPSPQVDEELKTVLGDDLSARFGALRGTVHPCSSSSSAASSNVVLPGAPVPRDSRDRDLLEVDDEVEKIIQWAKDAARLDPSPPSDAEARDDDEDDHSDLESSSDDDDSHSHRGDFRQKAKRMENKPRQMRNPK